MKQIIVGIEGETPLLMNSPKAMLEPKKEMTTKTERYDHKKEAEKVSYRMKNGNLYVPATAVKGCLVNACSFKKIGKYAARAIIAGGVRVNPEEIDLKTKKYEIDLRTVVIQRARIVKARPVLKKWKIEFEMLYNENMIADPKVIKMILEDAGQRVGLLDFRPQKSGNFGTFKITKFQIK